jgi:hypothetical protein
MTALHVKAQALVAVATAALAPALAGCSSRGPAPEGPLSRGGPIPNALGSNCAPGGRPQAFGVEQFTNHGRATVILDRVALLHPHNELLVGSYAVPGDGVLGITHWPPDHPSSHPGWQDRRPVPGFRVAPGKTFNMILGIAAVAQGRRATSRGMLVYYHDSAGRYVAKDADANILAASTRTCA